MITMDIIAKKAGVSKAAVSYAFSGSSKISKETREHILKIADEYNYVPNRSAQLLRRNKSRRIGLFIPRFSGSYYMYLIESIYMFLNSLDYQLDVHILRGDINDRINDIAGAVVDAAIVQEPFNDASAALKKLSGIMKERQIPLVFLGCKKVCDYASYINMNNTAAISEITDYLIATGHKKIIFIGNIYATDDYERYNGFMQSMGHNKIPIMDIWKYKDDDPNEWAGYQLVKSKFPNLKENPDAFCCSNDPLAIGCIKALLSFGYSVPKDISVTGFDNLIPANLFDQKLTTFSNPVSKIGKIAAEEAVRRIEQGEKNNVIVVDSEFVKGDTVAVRG